MCIRDRWYVNIVTQDGVRPHFKPDNPRKHFDKTKNKEKTIKYEQVINSQNGYFLPKMTYRHVKLIANINKVKKYPTGDLNAYCPEAWEWLAENKKIKKGVTEGAKKTLALLSVGVPTIGYHQFGILITPVQTDVCYLFLTSSKGTDLLFITIMIRKRKPSKL